MKKAVFIVSMLLALLGAAGAQTLKNLPVVAIAEIRELSDRTKEAGLGRIVAVMLRTEMDRSIVLRPGVLDGSGKPALEAARAAFPPKGPAEAFLLEGAVALLGESLSVDLWLTDVLTGQPADGASLQVPSLQQLRGMLAEQAVRWETSLFRGSLGSLTVSSTPSECSVFLDGRWVGQTGRDGRLEVPRLQPGPYLLRVSLPGHLEHASEVTVQARRVTALAASLDPEPGSLVVDSVPPGASVGLDARNMGVTPLRVPSVSPGEHKVTLGLEGYVPWERRISVGSLEEVGLNARLELLRGSLRVESSPPGATVSAGGRVLGVTPLQVYEMDPGPYLLEVSLRDYDVATVSARIERGKESSYAVPLAKRKGFLTVHSSPEGARVVLESGGKARDLGATPLEKAELEIGSYLLRLSRDGFHPQESGLSVEAGKVAAVEAALRPVPGSIRVETDPRYAEVLLDGVSRGVSPLEITGLPPGAYRVAVRTAFGSAERAVEVLPGRVTECPLSVARPPLLFLPAAFLTALSVLFACSVFGG